MKSSRRTLRNIPGWFRNTRLRGREECPFPACPNCGAYYRWDTKIDQRTGSSVQECMDCGHWLITGRGYLDKAGIIMDDDGLVGSYGTFSVRSEHVTLKNYGPKPQEKKDGG